jgi:uncharacterized protein involved in type VI secretion and phage assembly
MAPTFGKHRGTVVATDDPLRSGRVRVQVPDVLGNHATAWAMPCVPYGSSAEGGSLIPPVGTMVWIEFEAGDASRPIWSGGWWGPSSADDGRPTGGDESTSEPHRPGARPRPRRP